MTPVLVIARLVIKEIFRKKDFYVALILIGVILFYAQGLQFYNVKNISRYLMEIGLALTARQRHGCGIGDGKRREIPRP